MMDQSVRQELYEKDKRQLEEDMSPFGFIMDGLDDDMEIIDGEQWRVASDWKDDPYWDKYKPKVDEYGMAESEWMWANSQENNSWY